MTLSTTIELPDVHPFVGMDVWSVMQAQAERRGGHNFLVWEPGGEAERMEWTYAEFAAEAERVAGGLVARGVRRGDPVMLLLENSPAFLLCWFACARLGAVAVDTNTLYRPDEIAHGLALTDPVGVITHEAYADRLVGLPGDRWTVTVDEPTWTCSALTSSAVPLPDHRPDPVLPLCVQFTSGTTSRPKAVLYTHANALWGGRIGASHTHIGPDDVFLVFMPLFHTAALLWQLVPTVWSGGTAVVMPKYSASRFWEVSLRNRCTQTLPLGITQVTLADQPVPEHCYRIWQSPLEQPDLERRYGVRAIGCWGMTEVVTNVLVGAASLPDQAGAIGRPAPEYEVRVVDDDGEPADLGDDGELRVRGIRGLSLFAEYLGDPVATAEAFDDDGFFRTGDRVRRLPTGEIQYVSRIKDMLKVGGENVAAAEIERVCMEVPGVIAAAVVARRDRMLDEVPVAFVVAPGLREDVLASQVIEACERSLAAFKVPRAVHLIDELPESLIGKIAKARLRELAVELASRPSADGSS